MYMPSVTRFVFRSQGVGAVNPLSPVSVSLSAVKGVEAATPGSVLSGDSFRSPAIGVVTTSVVSSPPGVANMYKAFLLSAPLCGCSV